MTAASRCRVAPNIAYDSVSGFRLWIPDDRGGGLGEVERDGLFGFVPNPARCVAGFELEVFHGVGFEGDDDAAAGFSDAVAAAGSWQFFLTHTLLVGYR